MSVKKISNEQPKFFKFSEENLEIVKNEIKKYPKNRKESSVLALLYLVQKQNDNWIPLVAIKYVARAGHKTTSKIEDLEKAIHYLENELHHEKDVYFRASQGIPYEVQPAELSESRETYISENACD